MNHIEKKKTPCKPSNIIIIDKTPKKAILAPTENFVAPKLDIKKPIINIESDIEDDISINNKYKCNFCNKEFTRSSSLSRHLTSRCKIRKEEVKEKEEIFRRLLEKMDKLEEQTKELQITNKHLCEEIKTLKTTTPNNLTTTNGNVQNNNGTITSQNNGTINNTINIIQHGKEDLSKIENSVFINSLLKYSGAKIPEKIIEGIHFNEKYPEFKNIYISDINREKVMMHNGTEWVLTNDDVTANLLDKSIIFSETKYEQLEDKIKQPAKKKIDKELKMLNLMKEFDELTEVNEEEDGVPLTKKEISRRHYLRNKAIGYLKLLLYNSRNIIIHALK